MDGVLLVCYLCVGSSILVPIVCFAFSLSRVGPYVYRSLCVVPPALPRLMGIDSPLSTYV